MSENAREAGQREGFTVEGHGVGRSLAQNTALIAACRVATAVSALVLIPVVVGTLGVAGYGTWEAIVAVASLTLMFQGAISSTAIWQASTAFGAGRPEDVHRAARIGITATLLVLAVIAPAVWVWRDSIVEFLNVGAALRPAAAAVLPGLVAVMILGGITESLSAVVTAHQRAGLASITSAAGLLGNYATVIVALQHGYGLNSLLAGYTANLLIQGAGLYFVVSRLSGPLPMLPIVPTAAELQALGSYYGLILLGFVSSALRDQTDKIVLASMASPVWVGYYAIASRLAGVVIEVSRFFYVPTMAAIASLNAAGDWSAIQRVFSRMMTAGALATGAVAVTVASHYDRLLVLWMGEYPAPVVPIVLLLLAGNTAAVVLTGAGTSLCRAVGRVGIETTYVVVNLVANLILTVLLVLLVGPIGTVVASAFTWGASAIVFLVVLHRRLDLPTGGTFNALRTIAAILLAAGVVRLVSLAVPVPDSRGAALLSLCWLAPLTLVLYAGLAHALRVFTAPQVASVVRHLQQSLSWRALRVAAVRSGN